MTRGGHRDWSTQKKTNTYQQTYSLRHSILNSTIVYSKEKQVTLQRMKTNTGETHEWQEHRRRNAGWGDRQAHTKETDLRRTWMTGAQEEMQDEGTDRPTQRKQTSGEHEWRAHRKKFRMRGQTGRTEAQPNGEGWDEGFEIVDWTAKKKIIHEPRWRIEQDESVGGTVKRKPDEHQCWRPRTASNEYNSQ